MSGQSRHYDVIALSVMKKGPVSLQRVGECGAAKTEKRIPSGSRRDERVRERRLQRKTDAHPPACTRARLTPSSYTVYKKRIEDEIAQEKAGAMFISRPLSLSLSLFLSR